MDDNRNLKENVTHGSLSFPFCVYTNDLGYKEHLLDYHWHNEIEFLYLSKGKAVFQIDSTPVELHENEAVFINRGEVHSGYSLDHAYCVYYSIVFSLEMLYSNPQDICYKRYFSPLISCQQKLPQKITVDISGGRRILNQIKDVIKAYTGKEDGYEMVAKSSLFMIFSLLYSHGAMIRQGNRNILKQYQTERLKKVLNYIKNNYSHKISIDDLANEVNLSRYHFSRFFKSLTSQTPIEYINYFRVNQAAKLLEEDHRKITDISLEVGFNNVSYFIEMFKKYKECTPSEYRKSIR